MENVLNMLPNAGRLKAENPQTRDDWLALRRMGVGGSDVAAICGVSPWSTPLKVWKDKTGQGEDDGRRVPWRMKLGIATENAIATTWAERIHAELFAVPMLTVKDRPFVANIDRIAVIGDSTRVLEVKFQADKLEDAVPPHYFLQVLWYQHLTGLVHGDLVVGGQFHEPAGIPIRYDPGLAAEVEDAVMKFWTDHVLTGIPPAPTTLEERGSEAMRRLRDVAAEVHAEGPLADLGAWLFQAKAAVKAAKAAEDEAEVAFKEAMATAGAAKVVGSEWRATLIDRAGSIGYKDVVESLGVAQDVIEGFRGPPSRYLRVDAIKAKGAKAPKEG